MPSSFTPFVLVTDRMVFVPNPIAVSIKAYRALFKRLHEDHTFCDMGFGDSFPARPWTDDEIRDLLQSDVTRGWGGKNMGDFAVGLLPCNSSEGDVLHRKRGRQLGPSASKASIIEDSQLADADAYADVEWVGYACARDGTTCIPPLAEGDAPLPPWQDMLEMRYGIAPEHWGKGLALEASKVVVQWAVEERGARRFIAETQKANQRSGRVLEKLGFKKVDTNYFQEKDVLDEWEMVAA
ncbi:hypothetical protein QQS21_001333 [Conoideocrella luteorostrata]|uniref:N-acetyltransferase domain-containing protein n=1 Tax=Conoideocrella luteorostrata TaxID=1105319 RepID=A0AAJ0CXJ5_9HYPO|nr:hypothetical protein QQS21_001333 [Conoideocrella luteorostrata]